MLIETAETEVPVWNVILVTATKEHEIDRVNLELQARTSAQAVAQAMTLISLNPGESLYEVRVSPAKADATGLTHCHDGQQCSHDHPRKTSYDHVFDLVLKALIDGLEEGPADERLTDAIMLLTAAKDSIDDFLINRKRYRRLVELVRWTV